MTFTHSPGPWALAEYDDNNVVVNSPGHGAFCSVVVAMEDGPRNQEENRHLRGNAQLVSHALAMYEALKRVDSMWEMPYGHIAVREFRGDLGQLIKSIETVPVSREEMLNEVVEDMVLSLGARKAREEYARRKFEALPYEQLVKAYNDMQVPE